MRSYQPKEKAFYIDFFDSEKVNLQLKYPYHEQNP